MLKLKKYIYIKLYIKQAYPGHKTVTHILWKLFVLLQLFQKDTVKDREREKCNKLSMMVQVNSLLFINTILQQITNILNSNSD